MNQIMNQYSALWMAGAFVLLVALIIFRHKPTTGELIALGVMILGLGVAWSLLRPQ
jgi:hypothetical protein